MARERDAGVTGAGRGKGRGDGQGVEAGEWETRSLGMRPRT